MSANIFKHEFRIRLKSIIIWSVAVSAIVMVFFSVFPVFADQAIVTEELLSKYPPALLEAFGIGKIEMASVLGFYGFLFVFIQLCTAIQAGNYGFGLVSIEENELTADFLLTKPVSRLQVIVSKLLAALTSLVVTDLVILAVSLLAMALFNNGHPYDIGVVFLLMLSLLLFQLFFLSVGLVVSLLVKRVRSVTPYSLGLGFGAYVLNAFSGVFGDVKLEYITPFKHLNPIFIIQNSAFDTPLVLINVLISLVALLVSVWLYTRRDISAVS